MCEQLAQLLRDSRRTTSQTVNLGPMPGVRHVAPSGYALCNITVEMME